MNTDLTLKVYLLSAGSLFVQLTIGSKGVQLYEDHLAWNCQKKFHIRSKSLVGTETLGGF